jgi:eukaryotic-like serine/threonine-protein kinase
VKVIAGRYELVAPMAKGGMGEIWEGRDQRLNRTVAVKLLHHDQSAGRDEIARRFYREARMTARLRHPGVPVLYDFGAEDESFYMVMEPVPGHTAAELIAELDAVPIPWAAVIGAQICAVLAAAHAMSLVHRDLKPANIVISPNGTVKVLDFGVAAVLGSAEFSQITQSGAAPGTARYMAPEVLDGHQADHRSDLYALGCVLHELLTGSRVFAAEDSLAEIGKHLAEDPPPVRTARPEIPEEFERLVLDLLAKQPRDRPKDTATVYRRLLPLVHDVPALPNVVRKAALPDPTHMYAIALERITGTSGLPR